MGRRGNYDRLVRFERAATVRTAIGTIEQGEWTLIQEAWAKLLFGTGAERREAAATEASQSATFRVTSTAALRGVTERDRIVMAGRAWQIVSISPVGGEARDIEFVATAQKD